MSFFYCFGGFLGLFFIGLIGLKYIVYRSSKGSVFDQIEAIPSHEVGLVLGCSESLSSGAANPYFRCRICAAADLWHAGKVRFLLVSGDRSKRNYDEPTAMKEALVDRGVSSDRIHCDYSGFRTLDSIIRAKKVFQLDRFIIVSQEFHVRRAIYIGSAHDLSLCGYSALNIPNSEGPWMRIRENGARLKAVLDIAIWNTQPKLLESPRKIGEEGSTAERS